MGLCAGFERQIATEKLPQAFKKSDTLRNLVAEAEQNIKSVHGNDVIVNAVVITDGNVMMRSISQYKQVDTKTKWDYDSYVNYIHSLIMTKFHASSGVVIVVFDDPKYLTQAKDAEQRKRDKAVQKRKTKVECKTSWVSSDHREDILNTPTDENFTREDLKQENSPNIYDVLNERGARCKLFDMVCKDVMEKFEKNVKDIVNKPELVFDGIDVNYEDRSSIDYRNAGILCIEKSHWHSVFGKRTEIGEGDLKLRNAYLKIQEHASKSKVPPSLDTTTPMVVEAPLPVSSTFYEQQEVTIVQNYPWQRGCSIIFDSVTDANEKRGQEQIIVIANRNEHNFFNLRELCLYRRWNGSYTLRDAFYDGKVYSLSNTRTVSITELTRAFFYREFTEELQELRKTSDVFNRNFIKTHERVDKNGQDMQSIQYMAFTVVVGTTEEENARKNVIHLLKRSDGTNPRPYEVPKVHDSEGGGPDSDAFWQVEKGFRDIKEMWTAQQAFIDQNGTSSSMEVVSPSSCVDVDDGCMHDSIPPRQHSLYVIDTIDSDSMMIELLEESKRQIVKPKEFKNQFSVVFMKPKEFENQFSVVLALHKKRTRDMERHYSWCDMKNLYDELLKTIYNDFNEEVILRFKNVVKHQHVTLFVLGIILCGTDFCEVQNMNRVELVFEAVQGIVKNSTMPLVQGIYNDKSLLLLNVLWQDRPNKGFTNQNADDEADNLLKSVEPVCNMLIHKFFSQTIGRRKITKDGKRNIPEYRNQENYAEKYIIKSMTDKLTHNAKKLKLTVDEKFANVSSEEEDIAKNVKKAVWVARYWCGYELTNLKKFGFELLKDIEDH